MKVAKPQCIYVPVGLWTYVPPKSRTIWTNLKNKANFKIGKMATSPLLTSIYEDFKQFFAFLRLKTKPICLDSRHQTSDSRKKDAIKRCEKNFWIFSKRWNFSAFLYA